MGLEVTVIGVKRPLGGLQVGVKKVSNPIHLMGKSAPEKKWRPYLAFLGVKSIFLALGHPYLDFPGVW